MCANLQGVLVLWTDWNMSAWLEQDEGGLLHAIGLPLSATDGRSGLFTTSRPGCTPCQQPTKHVGSSPAVPQQSSN